MKWIYRIREKTNYKKIPLLNKYLWFYGSTVEAKTKLLNSADKDKWTVCVEHKNGSVKYYQYSCKLNKVSYCGERREWKE